MAGYKIKSGDTLSQIAKRNNTTIKAIMAMNPSIKDPNKIRAGATLKMASKGVSGDSSMDESAPKNKKVNPYAGQSKKDMEKMQGGKKLVKEIPDKGSSNKKKLGPNPGKKMPSKRKYKSFDTPSMNEGYMSIGGKVFTGR